MPTNPITKKKTLAAFAFAFGLFMVTTGMVLSQANLVFSSLHGDHVSNYSITLDSSNKVTEDGEHTQKTALNNNVVFTYSGVANSTSGHVTLANTGKVVNKDHIRSIESLVASFNTEDSLQFRVSFDGQTWGGYTSMASDYRYYLDSNPYYVEFSALKSVTVNSINIQYSCAENPKASGTEVIDYGEVSYQKIISESQLTDGRYLIVYESSDVSAKVLKGNLGSNNYTTATISSNKIAYSSTLDSNTFTFTKGNNDKYTIKNSNNEYLNGGNKTISLSTSVVSQGVEFTSDGDVYLTVSSYTLRFNNNNPGDIFRYYGNTGMGDVYLYKRVETQSGSHTEYETPVDTIGFRAEVSKDSYYHDQKFDESTLSVVALKTDGTTSTLTKGASGYSYRVYKQGASEPINVNQIFGEEGTYLLEVSYGDYIPQVIYLNVGYNLLVSSVTLHLDELELNTDMKLADYLADHLTADITYNKESENVNGVAYSDFASKGVSLALINPNQVSANINNKFGIPGTWTIKVSSIKDSTVFGETQFEVTSIGVSQIVITPANPVVDMGKTVQLSATVTPDNATDKSLTWESSDTSVATVSTTGLVTGKAEGTATITARSVSNNTINGSVTLTVNPNYSQEIKYIFTDAEWSASPANWTSLTDGDSFVDGRGVQARGGTTAKATSPRSFNGVSKVVVNYCTNASSGAGAIYIKIGSNEAESFTVTSTGGSTLRDAEFEFNTKQTGVITLSAYASSNSVYVNSITITEDVTPTDPTNLSIPSKLDLLAGGSKQLEVTYTPSNANRNLGVTWESSNTDIATVEDGLVTVKDGVQVGDTATITATLGIDNSKTSQCVVTVVEEIKDAYTVMLYICGSDLETDNGFATSDIQEILSVDGQPDDINIIIETGGAKEWASTYDIPDDKLARWEVRDHSLNKVAELSDASMGLSSTFKSFVQWGLNNYPAEKAAIILWNHGGAMRGACYDENHNNDNLLTSEIVSVFEDVIGDEQLEWVGYDCCLMQVQDIAQQYSKYFKYMVASEESEAGEGWEYSTWLDDLYSGQDTSKVLKAICDGFVNSYKYSGNDQTLSYLDLSKMDAYYTAWEDMAEAMHDLIGSYGKTNFQNLMKTVKEYGTSVYTQSQLTQAGYSTNTSSDYYYGNYGIEHIGNYYYDYGYTYFGIFDALDFLNKISNTSAFNGISDKVSATKTAFNQLVAYSKVGSSAGNSNGLCMYFPLGSWCNISKYYEKNVQTKFTKWWQIVNDYGINS